MTGMAGSMEEGRVCAVLAAGNFGQERHSNRWRLAIAILSLSVLCPALVRAQSHGVQAGPKVDVLGLKSISRFCGKECPSERGKAGLRVLRLFQFPIDFRECDSHGGPVNPLPVG